jgi:hypothetical protein
VLTWCTVWGPVLQVVTVEPAGLSPTHKSKARLLLVRDTAETLPGKHKAERSQQQQQQQQQSFGMLLPPCFVGVCPLLSSLQVIQQLLCVVCTASSQHHALLCYARAVLCPCCVVLWCPVVCCLGLW